jgi:signal transduction histidine kinase
LVRLRFALGAIVLGVLVVAAALGWFLASQAMRPVDRITQAAQAIGRSTDFSRRLPETQRRDELGRLTVTFNEMLDRLAEAVDTQRRFLADASHELRTPLTVVRTNAELALHGEEATARAGGLRTIARETDRMGRLVADLLVLARADAGQPLVRGRVTLDRLLLEVYHQQRPLAFDARLELGDLDQIEIDGDADRLRQLLHNLVDNAVRHTPPGGVVTLALSRSGGWTVVRVSDTGAGISAEHLPHIFERFYRVDRRRSRAASSHRGSGLGLSICQWVAEAHGGRIEVASRVGVGSTFSVFLPVSAAAASTKGDAAQMVAH